MNYCSIEDAWGSRCNSMSNQMNQYINERNPAPKKSEDMVNLETEIEHFEIEHFEPVQLKPTKKSKTINKIKQVDSYDDHHIEINSCDDFMLHVKSCRKCYNRMRTQFKPQLIENFQDMIDGNRDTIVLILIGISILLFFNLINNITSSK
jgi:hypothetical protein